MSTSFTLLDPGEPSSDFRDRCALAVMAKAPVAGRVKTRLSPPLTPEQAAGLNACFLRDTVANLADSAAHTGARWIISYAPVGEEAAFRGLLPPEALLLPQRGNGFGERLLRTAEDLFACGFSSVCLIDSDSPTVPRSSFVQAVESLAAFGDRVVLGPSSDGGYYLLGLKRPHQHLFKNILWSTAAVADQTRDRAKDLGVPVVTLPVWYDVDDAVSLGRLRQELSSNGLEESAPSVAYRAPFTRAYLERFRWSLKDASGDAGSLNKKEEVVNSPN